MADRKEVRALRDEVFQTEMRQLASCLKHIVEELKHIDVKLDMLQEEFDELGRSLQLSSRLFEVERALGESGEEAAAG